MAERVVDQLEVVQVDHQYAQRRTRTLRPDDLFAQSLVQEAVVVEAGELVAVCQLPGVLVQAGVLERHGGFGCHRPGEVELRGAERP